MRVICFAVFALFVIVSCQDGTDTSSGSNIASDIMKGSTLCMRRFAATTGHDINTMGMLGYTPPCDIYEAYMACSLENVENVLGTDMTPDIAISLQKQLNQPGVSQINCSFNITALIQKIHDGTAPTLGPPGNASIPSIDAMVICMNAYTKSLENIGNFTTEICPKIREFSLCYFRSIGLNISGMNDTQVQNLQYQWDNQITQVEHQTGARLDCHIDIRQIFGEILNGSGATGPPPLMTLNASSNHVTSGFTDGLDVICSIRHPQDTQFSSLLSLIVSKTSTSNDWDTDFSEIATLTSFAGDHPEVNASVAGVKVTGHIEATKDSFMTLSWAHPTSQAAGRYMCEAWGMDKRGHPSMVGSVVTVVQATSLDASLKPIIDHLKDRLQTCEEDNHNTTLLLDQCMRTTPSSRGTAQQDDPSTYDNSGFNANLNTCQQDLQNTQRELQMLKTKYGLSNLQ